MSLIYASSIEPDYKNFEKAFSKPLLPFSDAPFSTIEIKIGSKTHSIITKSDIGENDIISFLLKKGIASKEVTEIKRFSVKYEEDKNTKWGELYSEFIRNKNKYKEKFFGIFVKRYPKNLLFNKEKSTYRWEEEKRRIVILSKDILMCLLNQYLDPALTTDYSVYQVETDDGSSCLIIDKKDLSIIEKTREYINNGIIEKIFKEDAKKNNKNFTSFKIAPLIPSNNKITAEEIYKHHEEEINTSTNYLGLYEVKTDGPYRLDQREITSFLATKEDAEEDNTSSTKIEKSKLPIIIIGVGLTGIVIGVKRLHKNRSKERKESTSDADKDNQALEQDDTENEKESNVWIKIIG